MEVIQELAVSAVDGVPALLDIDVGDLHRRVYMVETGMHGILVDASLVNRQGGSGVPGSIELQPVLTYLTAYILEPGIEALYKGQY